VPCKDIYKVETSIVSYTIHLGYNNEPAIDVLENIFYLFWESYETQIRCDLISIFFGCINFVVHKVTTGFRGQISIYQKFSRSTAWNCWRPHCLSATSMAIHWLLLSKGIPPRIYYDGAVFSCALISTPDRHLPVEITTGTTWKRGMFCCQCGRIWQEKVLCTITGIEPISS